MTGNAIASYNSGEGNVRKAVRRNLRAGKPTDFFSLKLPRETRSYVPRLLAVSAIVADPDSHGLTLKPIPDEPYFAATELDGQIDLALAADMAEVTLEELYLLNPGWREVLLLSNINRADYEAAIFEVVRRQFRGWELQGSYTWSRAKGDAEDYDLLLGNEQSLMRLISAPCDDDDEDL